MITPPYYIDLLAHMSVNKNKSKTAPHKAILLLTIIDMIEEGEIISPFIPISESLQDNFKRIWSAHVSGRSGYEDRIAYPFFHLSSSPFWELVKTSSYQGQTEYSSIRALVRDFSGAFIDDELFYLMKNPVTRAELKSILQTVYLDSENESSNLIGIITIFALICAVA